MLPVPPTPLSTPAAASQPKQEPARPEIQAFAHEPEPEPINADIPAHFHPHASAPQPATKPPGSLPSLKGLPKLGKLKDIEKEVLAPKREETVTVAADPEDETVPSQVNLQLLEQAWKDFTKARAEHHDEVLVLQSPYQVTEQAEVILEVNSPLQINVFEKFREEFTHFLRRQTGNNRIKIKLEVKEQEETNRLYTNQDRLKYLSEKYPMLQEVASKFGLDSSF